MTRHPRRIIPSAELARRIDDRRRLELLRDQDDYWMRKGLQIAVVVLAALLSVYLIWRL